MWKITLLPEDFNYNTDKLYLMSKKQYGDYVSQLWTCYLGTEVVFRKMAG